LTPKSNQTLLEKNPYDKKMRIHVFSKHFSETFLNYSRLSEFSIQVVNLTENPYKREIVPGAARLSKTLTCVLIGTFKKGDGVSCTCKLLTKNQYKMELPLRILFFYLRRKSGFFDVDGNDLLQP
jgi:hypothetical protein